MHQIKQNLFYPKAFSDPPLSSSTWHHENALHEVLKTPGSPLTLRTPIFRDCSKTLQCNEMLLQKHTGGKMNYMAQCRRHQLLQQVHFILVSSVNIFPPELLFLTFLWYILAFIQLSELFLCPQKSPLSNSLWLRCLLLVADTAEVKRVIHTSRWQFSHFRPTRYMLPKQQYWLTFGFKMRICYKVIFGFLWGVEYVSLGCEAAYS